MMISLALLLTEEDAFFADFSYEDPKDKPATDGDPDDEPIVKERGLEKPKQDEDDGSSI